MHLRNNIDGGSRVTINSSRSLAATKLLYGKTPQEALTIVPALYNICGHAQAQAAHIACARAAGQRSCGGDGRELAREILVMIETAKEHLARIFIDWPQYLGEDALVNDLKPVMQMPPGLRKALFVEGEAFGAQARLRSNFEPLGAMLRQLDDRLQRKVFATTAELWCATAEVAELAAWMERGETVAARLFRHVGESGWSGAGRSAVGFLPPLGEGDLRACLDSPGGDAFIAQPLWYGEPQETTALARQQGHPLLRALSADHHNGLLPRLCARLLELAGIPSRIKAALAQLEALSGNASTDLSTVVSGTGIGQVEAARGRLIHRVELRAGMIERYQILAPTEWNFHPRGVVAQGLAALRGRDAADLPRLAAMFIHAVDPCVACDVTVH